MELDDLVHEVNLRRRELKRNPSLMRACGFEHYGDGYNDIDYRVPSKSALSRFIAVVLEVERDAAGLSQMQQRLTDELVERLPDFGADVGFDGKALRSHSTGRRTARTGQPSDPDAAWGCHSYFSTDHTGREQKITQRWFGYKTHWLADVRYEIPINWTTRPANESEHRHSKALVEQYLNSPAGARCQTFVADRGLDDNPLRRMIHRSNRDPPNVARLNHLDLCVFLKVWLASHELLQIAVLDFAFCSVDLPKHSSLDSHI